MRSQFFKRIATLSFICFTVSTFGQNTPLKKQAHQFQNISNDAKNPFSANKNPRLKGIEQTFDDPKGIIEYFLKNPNACENANDDFNKKKCEEFQARTTGMQLTIQCPKLNHNKALTFVTGKMGFQRHPIDENAMFGLGSVTKSFTAVILLQLERESENESGNLLSPKGLDSTVGDILPGEYTLWKDITIRQLLHMTPGIAFYNSTEEFYYKFIAEPYQYFKMDYLLDLVKTEPLFEAPYEYSNTNYLLAGKIIEKITGNKLKEEFEKRIIKPLDLKFAHYIPHLPKNGIPKEQFQNWMSGYMMMEGKDGDELVDMSNFSYSALKSTGGMISNTENLNTYVHELFKPIEEGGKLLTSLQIKNELLNLVSQTTGQPIEDVNENEQAGYGLGIGRYYDPQTGRKIYNHNGDAMGYNAFWVYKPENEVFFTMAVNSLGGRSWLADEGFRVILDYMDQKCQ